MIPNSTYLRASGWVDRSISPLHRKNMGLTRSGIRVLVGKGRIHSNDSVYPSCPRREVRTGFYKKHTGLENILVHLDVKEEVFSNLSPRKNPGNMSFAP
jgi:hypothetical protein